MKALKNEKGYNGFGRIEKTFRYNYSSAKSKSFKIANEATGFEESFSLSNDVLKHGVQSITDLMVRPGMINLDFADVETVMSSSGKAMMGIRRSRRR